MIIDRCKKTEFKAFDKEKENAFNFRWGKKDIVERVSKMVDGKWTLTEETKDTKYCDFAMCQFFDNLPTSDMLTDEFNMAERLPSMTEMKTIGEAIGMTEEQMIPWMKEQLKRAINKHDKSRGADGVENFTISGVDVWMDKNTRTGLLLRFQAEKASGKTNTVLWHEGMQFPLVVDTAIQMLYAIEVYASQTYDKTAEHLAAVDKLASVDAFIAYDYKAGYPAQLAF